MEYDIGNCIRIDPWAGKQTENWQKNKKIGLRMFWTWGEKNWKKIFVKDFDFIYKRWI